MRTLVLILCLIIAAGAAAAQSRVALVIGNGAYAHTPSLPNPNTDAAEIGAAMQRLGFTVLTRTDLTADGMRAAIRDFAVAMEGAELALFFYAGHGLQVSGRNYLVPIDARVEREADVELSTIPLDLILAQMNRSAETRVVFLDACRNNPFETQLARSMGQSRSAGALGRGLAPIETDGGTFVGFATDPGEVAYDGVGRHSPFTDALLRHLEQPGLEINALMTRVRSDVYTTTERLQRPWSSSSLLREVFLAPVARTNEPERTADPRLIDLAAWEAARAIGDAAAYTAYLEQHPEGLFRELAETELTALAKAGVPAPPTETAAVVLPEEPLQEAQSLEPSIRPRVRATPEFTPLPFPGVPPRPEALAIDDGCDVCPRAVLIPGGSTILGSEKGGTEGPRTPQSISPFYLAVGEITVGEIRRYEVATGQSIPRSCFVWTEAGRMRSRDGAYWGDPGYKVAFDHPAACLSWDDAQAYLEWLNTEDPRGGWRLPTEAEFEYAARAGTDEAYPWSGGTEALCKQVNGAGAESRFNHRNPACSDGTEAPVPAGVFPANAYGLSHIIGNLWEWTADCWNDSHRGATSNGAVRTSGLCSSRVLRGGSWDDPPENLRPAYRVGIPKTRRQANVGFRVARDVD